MWIVIQYYSICLQNLPEGPKIYDVKFVTISACPLHIHPCCKILCSRFREQFATASISYASPQDEHFDAQKDILMNSFQVTHRDQGTQSYRICDKEPKRHTLRIYVSCLPQPLAITFGQFVNYLLPTHTHTGICDAHRSPLVYTADWLLVGINSMDVVRISCAPRKLMVCICTKWMRAHLFSIGLMAMKPINYIAALNYDYYYTHRPFCLLTRICRCALCYVLIFGLSL